MPDVIVTRDLTKIFNEKVRAVDGISVRVPEGEAFGFLGPNGAGKTTTVSILTTLLRPTSGSAEVDGLDVVAHPEAVRHRIGLAFQASTADGELTGRENLELASGLHGVSARDARPRIRELLEQMQLTSASERPAKTYSGGMRRRLELAVGVVHEPRILFLDEPTLGLDPQGRAGFWDYIRDLRKEAKMTIFLTTHYLEEADLLCDRVAIVDHGKIIAIGTSTELKDRMGGDTVVLRAAPGAGDLAPVLASVPGILGVQLVDGSYRVKCAHGETMVPTLVRACEAANVSLLSVALRKPSLDEVFLELTGREYREEGEVSGAETSRFLDMARRGAR